MKKIIKASAIVISITAAVVLVLYKALHGRSYVESSDEQA